MELSLLDLFLWVAPVVGFAVHFTVGRYNAHRVAEQWRSFPSAVDAERLGLLRNTVANDADMLDITLESARDARTAGDKGETVRFAGLAQAIVGEAVEDRQSRIQTLSLLIRMSLAVTPMDPLKATSFRIGELRSLAGIASAFHFFLVSPAERVLLRLQVLRLSFKLVFSLLCRRRTEIEKQPADDRAWKSFEDGSADFKTLDREHLATARACLVSMRMEPRVHVPLASAR